MRSILCFALAMTLVAGPLMAASSPFEPERGESFVGYASDRIIVQLDQYAVASLDPQALRSQNAFRGNPDLDAVTERFGIPRIEKKFRGTTLEQARTPEERALTRFFEVYVDPANIDAIIEAYQQVSAVTSAYKIPACRVFGTPNDTYYSSLWQLQDVYGIDADQAWDIEAGNPEVVIAVIDGGVEYTNPDLGGSDPPGPDDNVTNGNIWVNDQEIPGDDIDNDNNGYVDDVIGYDFTTPLIQYPCEDVDCDGPDNDPKGASGHGTFCAGEIAAITNNGYELSGVAGGYNDGTPGSDANGVKIVPCRAGYVSNIGGIIVIADAAEAMVYLGQLKARGVKVVAVNCSFGTAETPALAAAADYLASQDVLIVVAAGNSNVSTPDYLATRDDCMAVGATGLNGDPWIGSNYGDWVDIAGPSAGVLGMVGDNEEALFAYSGTSAAAPHVVGVAALLASYNPDLSAQDIWSILCDPANVKPYNPTKDVGVGIVNARMALESISPPSTVAPVADFVAYPSSGDAPLEVSFRNECTGGATSWIWDFGDDTPVSHERFPIHTYASPGLYTVTLTASNDMGSDVIVRTDYINTLNPPLPTSHVAFMLAYPFQQTYGPSVYDCAIAAVWIYDNNNRPVANARVVLAVTGPTDGKRMGSSDAEGRVLIVSPKPKDPTIDDWCFEVTDVRHDDFIYDPEANFITKTCESGPVYKSTPGAWAETQSSMPDKRGLSQNYPNPFNPRTAVRFSLETASHVKLTVYNIRGQKVAVLANEVYGAGEHAVEFDAAGLSSGVYLYRLETDNISETKKMILLK
ncbi:MAG: S8 family serine peptidase [Candidatus Zixiibacteriota bacterium]|nr:MAG: S8 family serine peptidase [candidate division Zixibacteria bacterium]